MRAAFHGTCVRCDQQIKPGDHIVAVRHHTNAYAHQKCAEKE